MFEVLREAISPLVLPFTLLLGAITVYWLLVAVGMLDFDADGTPDLAGGDMADVPGGDLQAAAEGAQGVFRSALEFLNIGNVPAMIVVSIMSLSLWVWAMIGNHYFNDGSVMRGLVLLVPNLALTIVLTKAITSPLKKFFISLSRDYEEHKPVVGRTCVVITNEVTDKFGQAQIDTSGAPLIINVRTYGDVILAKGESALIIKEDRENNLYTVAKLTTTTPQEESTIC